MASLRDWTTTDFIFAAAMLGAVVGGGSLALTAQGRSAIVATAKTVA